MTRRQCLLSLGGAAAGLPLRAAAARPPNIVFLMADDMGYGDPRCYNADSRIPTPHMDALARQGMRFTDAHSAASVCTPSRYSALTGRYCWRTRLKKEVFWSSYDEPLIESGRPTVASFLKAGGYATGAIGKWHLGMNFARKSGPGFVRGKTAHRSGSEGVRDVDFTRPIRGGPVDLGFDYYFGLGAGINLEPFCFIENDRTAGVPSVWREKDQPTVPGESASESHEGWMVPGWRDHDAGPAMAAKATAFIERCHARNPGQPFFLYFAAHSPHRPCTPPPSMKAKSSAGVRGDMVVEFDWTAGEIAGVLDRLGLAKDTLFIVTSDNGGVKASDERQDFGHKSCGDLRGFKGGLYEGGHRVPFIARWPARIPAGSVSRQLVCLSDLFATCAALTGKPVPPGAAGDSRDILPALLDPSPARPARNSIVHHDGGGNFAIRQDNWKLLLAPKGLELYDLAADPAEARDLAAARPEIVRRLKELLEGFQARGHSGA